MPKQSMMSIAVDDGYAYDPDQMLMMMMRHYMDRREVMKKTRHPSLKDYSQIALENSKVQDSFFDVFNARSKNVFGRSEFEKVTRRHMA